MTLYLRTPVSLCGALPEALFSTDRFAFLYRENSNIPPPPQSKSFPEIRVLEYVAHANLGTYFRVIFKFTVCRVRLPSSLKMILLGLIYNTYSWDEPVPYSL
jgi:hypothetical protein